MGNYSYMEERAFSYFESLEVVEFDESTNIYSIPKFAFLGCKNLRKINIPSSCILIDEGSFKDCTKLKSIEFLSNNEQKLEIIFDEAFYNCSSLESLKIPSSVIIIKNGAFMNCSKLKSFEIEHSNSEDENLTIIEKNAFKNCTSLESFNLPHSCSYLGPASFMNCINLKSFNCDGCNLNSINCRTFYNCKSLTKFELTNLPYITNSTTKNDINNLKDVEEAYLNNSKFNIFDEAFMDCSSLKSIIIEDKSKSIDTISKGKFENDSPNINKKKIINNWYLRICFIYQRSQKIQRNAFKNCKSLTNVRLILGNLESIHEDAFQNCSSLKTIEINSIYWRLLYSKSFNMPNNVNLQLYSNDKLIDKSFTISRQIRKKSFHSQKEYVRKESPLDWPISDNIKPKIKLRSTCIDLFDGPRWTLHVRPIIFKMKKNENYVKSDDNYNSILDYHIKLYSDQRYNFPYILSSEPKYNYPFDNIIHVQTEYNYNLPTPKMPPSFSKVCPFNK